MYFSGNLEISGFPSHGGKKVLSFLNPRKIFTYLHQRSGKTYKFLFCFFSGRVQNPLNHKIKKNKKFIQVKSKRKKYEPLGSRGDSGKFSNDTNLYLIITFLIYFFLRFFRILLVKYIYMYMGKYPLKKLYEIFSE